jgi:LmbE family N-acetylglucosaminyl deacetylase
MWEFSLKGAKSILCLGAHADDIEIGCGGTILTLVRNFTDLNILWVVFSAQGPRAAEARRSARAFLDGATQKKIVTKHFRNSFFPYEGERIKEYFEQLKQSFQPDLVFTHYRDDRHQDHRVLSDLAWNTFRNHLILEYEIPKYDGDLGCPNVFVRLDETLCRRKAAWVCKYFQTQGNKNWFSAETFLSLMRIRGMECASPTKHAEAFYCRKLTCR